MSGRELAPEITPRELIDAVEAGEPVEILDVRAPHRLAAGRVDVVPDERFHNIPGSQVVALGDPTSIARSPGGWLAVVCGLGNDSLRVAAYLRRRGVPAASLAGGVRRWMNTLVPRHPPAPAGFDRLVQMDRVGKGALGYLLVRGEEALAIDPSRDVDAWLETARELGTRLVAVADTHAHADYLSGARELARRTGVPYRLHPADAAYPYDGTPGRLDFEPLAEGESIELGDAGVAVLHTPGHTEGSVTLLAGGPGGAVFTGDLLFVASVGRPDLAGKTEAWTADLERSLVRLKKELAPEAHILPAHYAAAAERRPEGWVGAPFGDLPAGNEPLALAGSEAFAAWVTARAATFPDAYRRIKAANLGLEEIDPATADELESGRNECALVSPA